MTRKQPAALARATREREARALALRNTAALERIAAALERLVIFTLPSGTIAAFQPDDAAPRPTRRSRA